MTPNCRRLLWTVFALALATGLAGEAEATVIAERSGPVSFVSVNPENAVDWTTVVPFTNVTISASFGSSSFTLPGNGTVYLTDKIGPGTTTADEIARVSLTNVPLATFATLPTVLFTGLTLTAGTYYLVEASDAGSPGIGWIGASRPPKQPMQGRLAMTSSHPLWLPIHLPHRISFTTARAGSSSGSPGTKRRVSPSHPPLRCSRQPSPD
jgi:hypothetical protein